MSRHPIPDAALDDRLFFGGTAGSGKTYNAMGRVERLFGKHARVVIPDPLGGWWGLGLPPPPPRRTSAPAGGGGAGGGCAPPGARPPPAGSARGGGGAAPRRAAPGGRGAA